MDQLTPQDMRHYERLKKKASSDILKFRSEARQSAEEYTRPMRRLLDRTDTKDTPTYLLLTEWSTRIAPEIADLEKARESKVLRRVLSKHLALSNLAATDLTKQLVDERVATIINAFLNLCYGPGRAQRAARTLLRLPNEDIATICDRYITHYIYKLIADDLGVTFYDANASLLRRMYEKRIERRQVKKYLSQQNKRLEDINSRQQELVAEDNAIIGRILSLDLDMPTALEAYQKFNKQLGALKPEEFTAAKRLSLYTKATKKLRDTHASKQPATRKLADLQDDLRTFDDTLIELFDMTEAQHNTLLTKLKEYRKLEREANRITQEQADYAGSAR